MLLQCLNALAGHLTGTLSRSNLRETFQIRQRLFLISNPIIGHGKPQERAFLVARVKLCRFF